MKIPRQQLVSGGLIARPFHHFQALKPARLSKRHRRRAGLEAGVLRGVVLGPSGVKWVVWSPTQEPRQYAWGRRGMSAEISSWNRETPARWS